MYGVPVVMFANAIVGSKEYIGPGTGILLDPRSPLAPQLMQFLDRADTLRPEVWAKANIPSEVNSQNSPIFAVRNLGLLAKCGPAT
jgi:hypothetical protein